MVQSDNQTASSALYLVACVQQKAAGPASAADLYRSPWFRKARSYVEGCGCPWLILSALHGVVAPDQVIAPYDQTLLQMSAPDRREWGRRVAAQLEERGHGATSPIILLAGARYREPLAAWLGSRALVPMAGLGIGRQLAWLTSQTGKAGARPECTPT